MRKYTPMQLVRLLAVPALTVMMGLILLLSPDTASALVGKLLGWVFLLLAPVDFFSSRAAGKKSILRPLFIALIGLWVLANPLSITKMLGRILGLAFLIWGINRLRQNHRATENLRNLSAGAVTILGLVLFLLPMTASRLVLGIAGIVIIAIGVTDGYDRLRSKKRLEGGDDPNIIDVEKL